MSGFCRVISLKNAAYFGRLSYEFAFADFLTPLALRRAGGVFCVRILEAIASYWFESPQVEIQFLGGFAVVYPRQDMSPFF